MSGCLEKNNMADLGTGFLAFARNDTVEDVHYGVSNFACHFERKREILLQQYPSGTWKRLPSPFSLLVGGP